MGQHLYTIFLTTASIGFTVLANLVLKLASQGQGIGTIWPLSIINTRVLLAAGTFAMAFLFYTMLLKRLPLSLAAAVLSVQFVLVILAANLVLHEPVGTIRWLGIGLVAVGLLIVGVSPDTPVNIK